VDPLLLGPVAVHALLPRAVATEPLLLRPMVVNPLQTVPAAALLPGCDRDYNRRWRIPRHAQGCQAAAAATTRLQSPLVGSYEVQNVARVEVKGVARAGFRSYRVFSQNYMVRRAGLRSYIVFFAKLYGAPLGSCEMVCLKNYCETLDEE
jgi:hypothetical protein